MARLFLEPDSRHIIAVGVFELAQGAHAAVNVPVAFLQRADHYDRTGRQNRVGHWPWESGLW